MWDKIVYVLTVFILFRILYEKFYGTIKSFEYYYKFLYYYVILSTSFAFFVPILLLKGKTPDNGAIAASSYRIVSKLMGVKLHFRGFDTLKPDEGAVFVMNHQSSFDVLGAAGLLCTIKRLILVAKKELFYFWPFGLGLYLMDSIFVDRGNPKAAAKVLMSKACTKLQNKVNILIMPEGTRNSDSTSLLPFKKGAFNIAVAAQVPIVPIVVSRYYFINQKTLSFTNGEIIMQRLEPVPTKGLTMDDVPDLVNKVHSIMEHAYQKISDEVASALPADGCRLA